jgi:glutathione S-transferase
VPHHEEIRMKLYYSPGACSLSPHIVLREAGLDFDLVRVDVQKKTVEGGGDFKAINPKGYVPTLALDNGEVLTEGPAIVQYLADQVPAKHLAPPPGSFERVRLQEWLNFISTELHKSFGPLFTPTMPEEAKAQFRERIVQRLAIADTRLQGRDYLTGSQFTVADAYLFVVTSWASHVAVDVSKLIHLGGFMARVSARPAVQAALKAEGLLK